MRIIDDRVLRDFRGELFVKVGSINRARLVVISISTVLYQGLYHWATHHGRLERRLDLLRPQLLEVEMSREEGMIFDLLSAVDTESLRRVPIQQLNQERSGLGANFVREPKGVRQDLSVHLIGVLVIEWRETGELSM